MAAAQPVKYTKLNANQIKGFWAAWGGWCLDGMDAFIYALVLAPALAEHVEHGRKIIGRNAGAAVADRHDDRSLLVR